MPAPIIVPVYNNTESNASAKEKCITHHLSVQECNKLQQLEKEEMARIPYTIGFLLILSVVVIIAMVKLADWLG